MLYIDRPRQIQFRGKPRWHVHCTADSLRELIAQMDAMGIPRRAFHNKPGLPHYDLFDYGIYIVRSLGARQLTNRAFVEQVRLCQIDVDQLPDGRPDNP
jgi:hypothetical protein